MPELSIRNIDQITNDIRSEEINFSHLIDDLIDHVCCDVEYEMTAGFDFSEAYKRVKRKMGSERRLREIQEETLYAVDTKYRNMKNTMKISGIAGTIIFGVAALFKIQHWPGAGIMLTLGAIILAFVFMPSSLTVLWKETHNMKRLIIFISAFLSGFTFISGTLFKVQHWPLAGLLLLISVASICFLLIPSLLVNRLNNIETAHKRPVYIFGAFGAILYAMGLLFKIQHWPAATFMMVAGLLILYIIALPWYTWITWKREENITPKFIFILIAAFLILLPGTLINLNLQGRYENGYYPHLEKQNLLLKSLTQQNGVFLQNHKDSSCYEELEKVHLNTAELTGLIAAIESNLIEESQGNGEYMQTSSPALTHYERITGTDYNRIQNPFYLVNQTKIAGIEGSRIKELNKASGEYLTMIGSYLNHDELEIIKPIGDPLIFLNGAPADNRPLSLLSFLHSSALLKTDLAIIEAKVLRSVAGNKLTH
jgi:hypothetical protein